MQSPKIFLCAILLMGVAASSARALLQTETIAENTDAGRDQTRIAAVLKQSQIYSVFEYADWLFHNFKYREAKGDTWLTATDVIERRHGNCRDFVILNDAVLRVLGHKPLIFAIEDARDGHAVCAFKTHNRYLYFDNTELMITNATSPGDLAVLFFRKFHYAKLFSMDPVTRKTTFLNFGLMARRASGFQAYEEKLDVESD